MTRPVQPTRARRLHLSALCLAALLTACASTGVDDDGHHSGPKADRPDAKSDTPDPTDLARQVDVHTGKLRLAQLELAALVAKHEAGIVAARAEVALAEAELATFREFERPGRLGQAELDLRGNRDRALEAAEELAQIEAMYNEQDLDDRTREYVIMRGRRNAERAEIRLQLEEQSFAKLAERNLPAEEQKLALAVERAQNGLEEAQRGYEIDRKGKELAIDELQHELAKAQKEAAEGSKP